MKPFQTSLIHVLLGSACLTSAVACSGDDGADEPSQTTGDNVVPFAPPTGVATNPGVVGQASSSMDSTGGATGQPSASMQQPDGAMGQVSPSMDVGGVMGQPSVDLGGGATDTVVSFSADLGDLFSASCGGCHSFWRTNDDTAYMRAFDLSEVLLPALQGSFTTTTGLPFSIMPLGCGAGVGQGNCFTQEQVDLVAAWIDGGFEM